MKVYQVIFEVDVNTVSVEKSDAPDSGVKTDLKTEIEEEINYWTGPDLQTVTTAAAVHAYEYEKRLIAVRDVLTVTREIKLEDDTNNQAILIAARIIEDD